MQFPQLFRVRQRFSGPCVEDISAEVQRQLDAPAIREKVKPGERVAITAGSRGIANIVEILRAVVGQVKHWGAEPFIVPAMGSHGGATTDGQLEVLASYGITPEACGCPFRASMETQVVCRAPEGFDVHFDQHALEADHVIVCGRIKPHTDFDGAIQSGLMKMMLIGLGKHQGAAIYHRAFSDYSFDRIARSVSATVMERCRILTGLAILENGYEQTAKIEAVLPEAIAEREPQLLRLADQWMARLPFRYVDVLVVDEIGKNISGTGMDTNVVGRKVNEHAALDNEWPKIKKIVVRGLTDETHGNATGIGVADFTTERVVKQMDFVKTRVNCVTSGRTSVGMLPLYFDTDQEAIDAALQTIGLTPRTQAKLIRIPNTLHLTEIACSLAYLPEVQQNENLEVLSDPYDMQFDSAGSLQ